MAFYLNYTHPITDSALSTIFDGLLNKFQQFYQEESDLTGLDPLLNTNNTDLGTVSNYISAAITLARWLALNKPGNYTGPGSSPSNPFKVPWSSSQECDVISTLGAIADSDVLLFAFHSKTVFNPAVGNTYYRLNNNPKWGGIKWEDNKLIVYDRYNFEGVGDFGAAPTLSNYSGKPVEFIFDLARAMFVAGATVLPGTSLAVVRGILVQMGFNPNTGEFLDGTKVSDIANTLPYTAYTRDEVNTVIGNVATLYISNEFTAEQICKCNPELYRDAVAKGYLKFESTPTGSCSQISAQSECYDAPDNNIVSVGQAQPMPLLGLPYYTPRVMEIGTNPNSWSVGTNDKYPSPFTSFQQQITNNTYFLGPYAMWGPIAGRICLIVGGVNSGQNGFIAQCWDVFDDGNYNVDADGIQYSSKKDWWDNTRKIEVTVPNLLFSGRPMTSVKVAVQSFDGPGADNVWGPNYPISSSPFGSVNLSYLIPLVAITSRYF